MPANSLVDSISVKEYKSNQLKSLEIDLQRTDDATEIKPIASPTDLSISLTGRTASSFRLTTSALSQVCRTICPGLIKVIADLAAIGVAIPVRTVRPDIAVEMYNKTLLARFDELADKSLVSNLKTKQIDGIIGAGYRTLSNKSFFDVLQDAMETVSAVFHEAVMYGRTLVISYRFKDPITRIPEPFYGGYYFTNSEVGDCSVKIASMILRAKTNERAISMFKKGRMVHIGKTFVTRVRKAVYVAINKTWPNAWYKSQLAKLPTVSLGFTGLEEAAVATKIDRLVSRLSRRGLSSQLAERVVYSALYQGRDNVAPKAYEAAVKKQLWSNRTALDLYVALTRDAKTRSLSVRESMERLAFDILTNKISAGDK